MKQVVLILLFTLTIACSDDDSETDQGCLTGIPKSGPQDRVLIKCSTKEQYLAGSNTSAGGTSSWTLYSGHKWEKCGDCK
jgi:hypothetical protein